ncbi:acetylcholinesterase precursor [Paraphoma chrysanthemicola]|nr:acetylcholinesterase precursor [Paraphoma chrysanthemicola]
MYYCWLHKYIFPDSIDMMGLLGTLRQLGAAVTIVSALSTAQASREVTLPGYGSFIGTSVNQSLTRKALPVSVDAWLGIDYASQPVGDGRFAPVGAPTAFRGTKNATQYGFSCYQDPSELLYDEACLSMNVFRPLNTTSSQSLPVLIWVHGINSLGFLPHPIFERNGLLNLGLRDQELLFKFVQQYISVFGGDPRRVTIGGRSAGAHSVGIHLFHNYDKTTGASPLFSQALLQSGSITARSFPNASYPLYQEQFSRYLDLIGCSDVANGSDATVLGCLRSAPITAIQNASTTLFQESEYAITWPFQPTRGGPLLEQAGSTSGINSQFYNIPTITTNVRDEAKYYSPGDIETNEDFLAYIQTLVPGLTTSDLADLETLYPDPTNDTNGPYANSPNSTQYDRVSAALTDYMYACPGQETAIRMSSANAPVYKLLFAVNNTFPTWKGIPHTADTKYTWSEPSGAGGVQYPEVGKLLHGYFVDFVVHGNPSGGNRTGVPAWPKYVDGGKGRPGAQLRLEAFGNSRVEGDGIRRVQCEWWREEERAARLEK